MLVRTLIDTHTHIFDSAFQDDRAQVVERATLAGVVKMVLPGIDSQSHQSLIDTVRQFPGICYGAIGLHPTSVNDNPQWQRELEVVGELLEQKPLEWVAVGEIGLDLYWSRDFLDRQIQVLTHQVELAILNNLPVIIHTRDAWDEIIEVLQPYLGRFKGVFHSFSGELSHLEQLLRYDDIYIGIGGVVTYKKSNLPDIIATTPLERILLETDSPYLPPVPYRGKRNESSYLHLIAHRIAELKQIDVAQVAQVTQSNAQRLFKI